MAMSLFTEDFITLLSLQENQENEKLNEQHFTLLIPQLIDSFEGLNTTGFIHITKTLRKPNSLKRACLETVILHMSHEISLKQNLTKLPPAIVEQLISLNNWLNQNNLVPMSTILQKLKILMTAKIQSFEFDCKRNSLFTRAVFGLIADNTHKLTCLTLTKCSINDYCFIKTMFQRLKNLRYLKLNDWKCNFSLDELLPIIIENCPYLQHLSLNDSNLSDTGLSMMCELVKKNNSLRDLSHLGLRYTNVSLTGVLEALVYFPNLTEIDYNIREPDMSRKNTCNLKKTPHKYQTVNLMSVNIFSTPNMNYFMENMNAFVSSFPHITTFECFDKSLTNEMLEALYHIHSLEQLSLKCTRLSFDHGLVPVLKKQSKSLKYLKLLEMDELVLEKVFVICPNLKELDLKMNDGIASFAYDQQSYEELNSIGEISKLKSIYISYHIDDLCLSSKSLKLVLGLCNNIQDIYFCNISTLTNEVFYDILDTDSLSNVQILCLSNCFQVSWSCLDYLSNALQHILCIDVHYDGELPLNEVTLANFDFLKTKEWLITGYNL